MRILLNIIQRCQTDMARASGQAGESVAPQALGASSLAVRMPAQDRRETRAPTRPQRAPNRAPPCSRDPMSEPMSSPPPPPPIAPPPSGPGAAQQVQGPALGLLITAGIAILFSLLGLVMNLLGVGMSGLQNLGGSDASAQEPRYF